MSLTREEVKKIAVLSRLKLSDDEIVEYGEQLGNILQYIEQLNEVDINGVEPTAQVCGVTNEMREDAINECDKVVIKYALSQGEITPQNFIKAKKVL